VHVSFYLNMTFRKKFQNTVKLANYFDSYSRAEGVASTLSPFISPGTWSVQDPKDPTLTRDFTELLSRRTKHRNVLGNGYTHPAYPAAWR
jgi:hypothetical protein